jgi:predicted O-methyltransferase YrrM
MLIERLIQDNPAFHEYSGERTSWAVEPDTLRFIHSMLTPGMNTLETGCGQTTVVFAIAGTNHICITDDQEEVDRVKIYCRTLGLEDNITFFAKSSDRVLPLDIIHHELDYIFIDGAHRFPFPIIDYHYSSDKLRVGGILALDDYLIPSVEILYKFLCLDDNWDLLEVKKNTAYFRKRRKQDFFNDWKGQKINSKYMEDQKSRIERNEGNLKQNLTKFKDFLKWRR